VNAAARPNASDAVGVYKLSETYALWRSADQDSVERVLNTSALFRPAIYDFWAYCTGCAVDVSHDCASPPACRFSSPPPALGSGFPVCVAEVERPPRRVEAGTASGPGVGENVNVRFAGMPRVARTCPMTSPPATLSAFVRHLVLFRCRDEKERVGPSIS